MAVTQALQELPPRSKPTPRTSAEQDAEAQERRQALGQFFTPRCVADFAWDVLAYLWRSREGTEMPTTVRAVDPAMGEGVFLEAALARGIEPTGLCGVDLDASLTPAWRNRFGNHPKVTIGCADGLVNQTRLNFVDGRFDVVVGNPPFAGRGVRNLLGLLDRVAAPKQLALFANEASPAEVNHAREVLAVQARRLARRYSGWRVSVAGEGDDAVSTGETAVVERLQFASTTRLTPSEREAVRRLATFPIEAFFAERFVQLLRPGGMGAVILPDAIFARARLQGFRRWLLDHAQPLAVIGLPRETFTDVGAKLQTVLLFFRKRPARSTHSVSAEQNRVLMIAAPDPCPSASFRAYIAEARAMVARAVLEGG